LLETLPTEAGGVLFDGVQIVHEMGFLIGHPVDDALREIGKERGDAVAVFRGSENGTIGAISVAGVDGDTLLKAVVETWHAPAVVARSPRLPVEYSTWAMQERGGRLNVVYRRGDVVYIISTPTPELVEAILLDMLRDNLVSK
jgi:hypothetical protein